MKKLSKAIIVSILGWQVRRLRRKHQFTIIGVVGSIGKTSTKLAIAQMLTQKHEVRYQAGNYNDIVTVPLVIFGENLPSLFSARAWVKVFLRNERQIRGAYEPEVVVVELGTDSPGDIAAFKKYLLADIAVITAVSAEHMEFFADLDAVAREELSVIQFAKQVVINGDLVAPEYLSLIPEAITYGVQNETDFRISNHSFTAEGASFAVNKDGELLLSGDAEVISESQLYSLLAGVLVCDALHMSKDEIVTAIRRITPVSGRLQLLSGIKDSTIIDDTYNASPEAFKLIIPAFYRIEAPQKIALIGNMNELGQYSREAHLAVGDLCDPARVDEVITLGTDANEYAAAVAEEKGCKVTRCQTPYEAGEYIKSIVQQNALIFAKGSQNGVFAEEAVKLLLANENDSSKLVRQSPEWLSRKLRSFDR